MKQSDIAIGEYYEYRSSSYSNPKKVKVLDKGVPVQYEFYNGVQVRFMDTKVEKGVPSRTIKRPWSEWEEMEERRLEAVARKNEAVSRLTLVKYDLGELCDYFGIVAGIVVDEYSYKIRIALDELDARNLVRLLKELKE